MLNRTRKNQRWIPAYKARYWANIWRDNLSKPHCLLWLPGKCPLKPWQWLFRKRLLITSGSYHCGSVVKDLTGIHGDMGWIPGLAQWIKGSSIAMSCGVGHRCCLDLALWWLWHRLVGWQLQLQLDLSLVTSIYHRCSSPPCPPKKKKTFIHFKCVLLWSFSA